jgi:16S rRNA (uracil1498-N3)-methyltransferase
MHVRRFFVSRENIRDDRVLIRGQDARHISESLRLRAGDTISVLDGEGMQYDVVLEHVAPRSVRGRIESRCECAPDVNLHVALFSALPKGAEKIKFVLRRGTELGIGEMGFFTSARSIARIHGSGEQAAKLDRWERIVTDAAKQCRRASLPHVAFFERFSEVLDYCRGYDRILVAWEAEERVGLRDAMQDARTTNRIAIVIGPEGGFDNAEVQLAKECGATVFWMGKRILRSEFAGIVAATIILYEFGELG